MFSSSLSVQEKTAAMNEVAKGLRWSSNDKGTLNEFKKIKMVEHMLNKL